MITVHLTFRSKLMKNLLKNKIKHNNYIYKPLHKLYFKNLHLHLTDKKKILTNSAVNLQYFTQSVWID